MLIVPVAKLIAQHAVKSWHIHTVIVNQTEAAVDYKNVAMLQIPVGNIALSKLCNKLQELLSQCLDLFGVVKIFLNKPIKVLSMNPFHLQDWIPFALNLDPCFKKSNPTMQESCFCLRYWLIFSYRNSWSG